MRLFKVKEAAYMLRKKEATIRHWIRTGKMDAKKVGKHWLIEDSVVYGLALK